MNETTKYMNVNGWTRHGDGGTAGIYTNGNLFVMCNGTEWFASKTPNESERWAKGWATMLPAMKFADAHKGKRYASEVAAQDRYDKRQRKVMIRLDQRTEGDLIAKLESVDSMQAYIKQLIKDDLTKAGL